MGLVKYLLVGGAIWAAVHYLTKPTEPGLLIPQYRLVNLELHSPRPKYWVVIDKASGDEVASGEVVEDGLIMGTLEIGPSVQAGSLNLDVEGENARDFFADVKGKLLIWQRAV